MTISKNVINLPLTNAEANTVLRALAEAKEARGTTADMTTAAMERVADRILHLVTEQERTPVWTITEGE